MNIISHIHTRISSGKLKTAVLAVIVCLCLLLSAQTYATGNIGKDIKEMFQRALRIQNKKEVLPLLDSIQNLACRSGNREMETKAMYLRMNYWYRNATKISELDRTVNPLIAKCQQYGEERMLYQAVSTRATWLTNSGEYQAAINYMDRMMEYARKHNHRFGIIIGHVALGNINRMRMEMAPAIAEYRKALDYSRNVPDYDLGQNYKRIAECYLIAGHFDKVIATANEGVKESKLERYISGLLGMKAFALFMNEDYEGFRTAYNKFESMTNEKPDIQPIIIKCLHVMKLIDDGKYAEADEALRKAKHIGFWQYVDVGYFTKQEKYSEALTAMRGLNTSLYGDSKGSFATEWGRMSANVKNNMHEIDRQKAAHENALLELVRKNLELKNNELELGKLKSEESFALVTAEGKRLQLQNQKMISDQLSDSLANERISRQDQEQRLVARNRWLAISLGIIGVLLIAELMFYRRNKKLAQKLLHTNDRLTVTHEEMDKAYAEAQLSDRKKTEFIQNISHEIRTPLNSIVGFTQLLSDPAYKLSDEERLTMKDCINENSDILSRLISSILDLASLESGKYVMQQEPVCLNTVCKEAIEGIREKVAPGVKLVFSPDNAHDTTVTGDGQRIRQVVDTLLKNAARFTQDGHITVSVSAESRPGMITVSVTDTGCGVDPSRQDEIFSRFSKRDTFTPGTVLSLYIARTIIRKLGGEIDIDRSYTGGARFWFTLPHSSLAPLS